MTGLERFVDTGLSWVSILEAESSATEAKGSPDQPRDDHGRWTSVGGEATTMPTAPTVGGTVGVASFDLSVPPAAVLGSPYDPKQLHAYLAAHGQEWRPSPLPDGVKRGRDKECYKNASQLVIGRTDLKYAEGIAYASKLGDLPFLHAWAVDGAGRVVDPTWDHPERNRYFGVAYDGKAYMQHIVSTKLYGVLGGDYKEGAKVLAQGGLKPPKGKAL